MGHFFYFDPKENNLAASAGQAKGNQPKINLTAPAEWTYCEKEQELTEFAARNKK
ncbi:hypothetical protein [Desulforamulus hydrothermalis]|uniref:hypothetical protein n=1 Tax=Desulforamulus hydrothermalis TaxID=412895 RepID=UPI0002F59880|nr:hypothetical protein [Desulforamulus hydrothermalis]SHG89892.1 hypothetical protein SAMN02745177_00761 [Desulforamulus hydrothermalis Lam5 = DSM 18033]